MTESVPLGRAALGVVVAVMLAVAGWGAPASAQGFRGAEPPVVAAIEDFVANMYLQMGFEHPELISHFYADELETYWGKKNHSRAAVIADKRRYAARWPEREYQLLPGSLAVAAVPGRRDVYAVQFEFEYFVESRRGTRAGLGESQLLVQMLASGPLILAEAGRVLDRY